jgi:hypothetical protein
MNMKNIASALVKAQKAFGPALKSSTNPHFKSRYADLAACVEAVIEGLNTNGVMLMQQCHESDNGVIVETLFVHESGETMSAGKLHVPAAKQDPQGYGSALTYARRYSLMAACGIAPEDDDGNSGAKSLAKAIVSAKVTPTAGAMDQLTKEDQDKLQSLSRLVVAELAKGNDWSAYEILEHANLDNDQKVAIWTLFDSKQRATLKQMKQNELASAA